MVQKESMKLVVFYGATVLNQAYSWNIFASLYTFTPLTAYSYFHFASYSYSKKYHI